MPNWVDCPPRLCATPPLKGSLRAVSYSKAISTARSPSLHHQRCIGLDKQRSAARCGNGAPCVPSPCSHSLRCMRICISVLTMSDSCHCVTHPQFRLTNRCTACHSTAMVYAHRFRLGTSAVIALTADHADCLQLKQGHYFWLGEYERQVASTIDYTIKGDGRTYSAFLKSDSYVEGVGVNEIWQAFIDTKCVRCLCETHAYDADAHMGTAIGQPSHPSCEDLSGMCMPALPRAQASHCRAQELKRWKPFL